MLIYQTLRAVAIAQESQTRQTDRLVPFYNPSDRSEDDGIHVERSDEDGFATRFGLQHAYREASMVVDLRDESRLYRSEPEQTPIWKVCLENGTTLDSAGSGDSGWRDSWADPV